MVWVLLDRFDAGCDRSMWAPLDGYLDSLVEWMTSKEFSRSVFIVTTSEWAALNVKVNHYVST